MDDGGEPGRRSAGRRAGLRRAVRRSGGLALLAVPLLLATPSWAATPKLLGNFNAWRAYVVDSGDGKHCFVYSEPTEEKGDYSKRDKVSVSISHRTGSKVRNEISFAAGYPLKPESEVELVIDGSQRFKLFVDGESAWAPDSKTDGQIRAAIEKGSKMVVKGMSTRGTVTTDTYSLSGTTAALEKIDRECPK